MLARLETPVGDVLNEAIQHYVDHFNLNHPADLVSALGVCGLKQTSEVVLDGGRGAVVEVLMKRRHWIVHQLDVNSAPGSGHFEAQSISLPTAQTFRALVAELGEMIISDAEKELP